MIVWRTMQTAKRGHVAEVVALQREWNAKYATDSRVKGFRLLSSFVGFNELVVNEIEFESMADWESFYSDSLEAADFGSWAEKHYEMTTGFDHDFWVVEDRS